VAVDDFAICPDLIIFLLKFFMEDYLFPVAILALFFIIIYFILRTRRRDQ
jgi:hypothetical protein